MDVYRDIVESKLVRFQACGCQMGMPQFLGFSGRTFERVMCEKNAR